MTTGWDAHAYAHNFRFVPEYGRVLIDILDPQKGEKILDLGCGPGDLTAELVARGVAVTGIDGDANMIALAKQKHPTINFVQQNAENITLPQQFDAVFSNAALHWMDIGKVFPSVAKILRVGGRIAAEMGGIGNITAIEHAIYQGLESFGITRATVQPLWRFPTPAQAAQKLENAGFEVRYMNLFDRPSELTEETGGLKGWVNMFGRTLIEKVPPESRDDLLNKIESAARPALFRDGKWYADYRRFHFVAVKLGTS